MAAGGNSEWTRAKQNSPGKAHGSMKQPDQQKRLKLAYFYRLGLPSKDGLLNIRNALLLETTPIVPWCSSGTCDMDHHCFLGTLGLKDSRHNTPHTLISWWGKMALPYFLLRTGMGAQRGGFGTYLILVGRVPLLQPSIRATAISGVALFFWVNFGWSLDHWTGKSSWKSTDTCSRPLQPGS